MSLAEDIKTYLGTDTTLMAILTGGIHAETEISRQLTPSAFDASKEILPCALLKTNENKAGPHKESAQAVLSIFLYQRSGLADIEAACSRIFFLLDEYHASGIWQILYASETTPVTDEGLRCSVKVQRYNIFRRKA